MTKMGKMVATVGLVSALAAALSACSTQSDPDEIGVCIDPKTELRLADDACDPDGNDRDSSVWFFLPLFGWLLGSADRSESGEVTRIAKADFDELQPRWCSDQRFGNQQIHYFTWWVWCRGSQGR